MSTLGSKLRSVGQEALAYEAERLLAQTEEAKSAANYWQRQAHLWQNKFEELQKPEASGRPKVSDAAAQELADAADWDD